MNFINNYFTNEYIDELLKRAKETIWGTVVVHDDRTSYMQNNTPTDSTKKGYAVLNINSEGTEISLVINSCKLLLTKHIIDGYLIFSTPSIGFDNSIENFRENAKTLITFADFVDMAKEVFEETN